MAEIQNYAELNEAITKEMGQPIVTKWMVLGELIDEDGDRCTFYISSDACTVWDQFGLMEWHRLHRSSQASDE